MADCIARSSCDQYNKLFPLAALVQAWRERTGFHLQLVLLLLKVKVGNLVQLRCAHTYYLEPPVPLVGPLYLDGRINLPLYLDPELRISLFDLPLQFLFLSEVALINLFGQLLESTVDALAVEGVLAGEHVTIGVAVEYQFFTFLTDLITFHHKVLAIHFPELYVLLLHIAFVALHVSL